MSRRSRTRRRHRAPALGALAVALALPGAAAFATPVPAEASTARGELVVTRLGDDHAAGSLREVIGQAAARGADRTTVTLPEGRYLLDQCSRSGAQDTDAAGDLDLAGSAPLTIEGLGAGATIQQTCAGERVLDQAGPAALTLSNVTITGGIATGNPATGGGLRTHGDVVLDHVTFTNNAAHGDPGGPAVYDPAAPALGGALWTDGSVTVTDSTFVGNVATGGPEGPLSPNGTGGGGGAGSGGAIAAASVHASDVTFTANEARGASSAYVRNCAHPSLCFQYYGAAGGSALGGAVAVSGAVTSERVTATGNRATSGEGVSGSDIDVGRGAGGFLWAGGTVDVVGGEQRDNAASTDGGAISGGDVSVAGGQWEDNDGGRYGGALLGVAVSVVDGVFLHNRAGVGGAVNGASVDVTGSRFEGNVGGGTEFTLQGNAGEAGGGAVAGGVVSATTTAFLGNQVIPSLLGRCDLQNPRCETDPRGGAIRSGTEITLDRVTLDGNGVEGGDDPDHGGGGALKAWGSVSARNTTISDNRARVYGQAIRGGAIEAAAVDLVATTVAWNEGSTTIETPVLSTRQSILATGSGSLCAAAVTTTSGGRNWADDTTCGLGDATDHAGAQPIFLGPLQDNGGSTPTRAPAPYSPVVDAVPVDACAVPVDQRDVARPQGAACDIGAVEGVIGPPPAPADLGVTVTGPDTALADSEQEVAVTVSSAGGTGYPTVVIELPDGWYQEHVTLPPVAPPGAECHRAGATRLVCMWAAGIPDGGDAKVVVHLHLPYPAQEAQVRATVTGAGSDPNVANDSATHTIDTIVAIDFKAIPETFFDPDNGSYPGMVAELVQGGRPAHLDVSVVNVGPQPFLATPEVPLRVLVDLPAGVVVNKVFGVPAWTCAGVAPLVCTSAAPPDPVWLPIGFSLEIQALPTAQPGPVSITTRSDMASAGDPNPANDAGTMGLTIVPGAHLTGAFAVTPTGGPTAHGAVTLTSDGPNAATNVSLVVYAPATSVFRSVTATGIDCVPATDGSYLSCHRQQPLPVNSVMSVQFDADLPGGLSSPSFMFDARVAHSTTKLELITVEVPALANLGTSFHPVEPARILDSRGTNGGWNGALNAGTPRTLTLAGAGGLPANLDAVVLNVTVTGATADSFLTVYPAGTPPPTASNLNFAKGQTTPNAVTVKVGPGDKIAFANAVGATHVIVDVVGYYDNLPSSRFNPVTPTRLLDSRTGVGFGGKVTAGAPKTLQVTSTAGPVPPSADAVVLNVTATAGSTNSFLTVYPGSQPTVPTVSNLNFAAGQTVANLVTVKLSEVGSLRVANAVGAVDVVADVVGYFDPTEGDLFHSVGPTRLLDSRTGAGGWAGPLDAGAPRPLQVTGGAVRPDATAVIGNATVTASTANSYLTVQPAGIPPTSTSNINFAVGQTIPNLVPTKTGTNGRITFRTHTGSTHVIYDLVGWYAPR